MQGHVRGITTTNVRSVLSCRPNDNQFRAGSPSRLFSHSRPALSPLARHPFRAMAGWAPALSLRAIAARLDRAPITFTARVATARLAAGARVIGAHPVTPGSRTCTTMGTTRASLAGTVPFPACALNGSARDPALSDLNQLLRGIPAYVTDQHVATEMDRVRAHLRFGP